MEFEDVVSGTPEYSDIIDNFTPEPTRRSRVEVYLSDNMSEAARDIASMFYESDSPIAPTAVLIPIAAEQEAGNIAPALYQYSRQQTDKPFTVLLSLNVSPGCDVQRAGQTMAEVMIAKKELEGILDIRYALTEYAEPTIGAIRKDLWDATLMTAFADGAYDSQGSELIGINHDIDTESIHPHYIRNIQKFYRDKQHEAEWFWSAPEMVHAPAHTMVTHQYPFETHPNTAKAIYWEDLVIRSAKDHAGYEEGLVIPMSHYVQRGGFSPASINNETSPLLKGMAQRLMIPGTGMKTSPRRYIDRFPEHGLEGIWTTDSFSIRDQCRDQLSSRDATHDELEAHVYDSIPYNVSILRDIGVLPAYENIHKWSSGVHSDTALDTFVEKAEAALTKRMRRNLNIAKRALTSMDLPMLRYVIEDEMDIDANVELRVASMRKQVREANSFLWTSKVSG